jgi:hypothetical protein
MARQVSAARVAEKWSRVTPTRTEDYVQGVQSPAVPWAAATSAAQGNYEAGVQAAIGRKAFAKGVQAAGDARWQAKTVAKGGQRWGPGVQEGAVDMQAGFGPFADVINRTALPARFPRGDPRNLARVGVIAAALSAAKRGK